jgi:outer membrane biogenesis lipoprotein LolB
VIIGQYRDGGGQSMPRRIVLENVDTRVRLVIDRWIFH